MMSNLSEIDEIISNLKAIIGSNKAGVQLNCIVSDYYNIIGEPLSYKKFGYNSLVEFLESLKVFKIKYNGSNIFVYVVSDGKTEHLEQMINKQKSKIGIQNPFKRNTVISVMILLTLLSLIIILLLRQLLTVKKKKVFIKNDDKPKEFAHNRLLKFMKKSINQIQNKELKNSSMEPSELLQKKCSNQEIVYNTSIQPRQLPTYYQKNFNLNINKYKCKKIVTVTAVLSPSTVYVVVDDKNTNAVTKTILHSLDLFNEFPFIKDIVIEKLLNLKCIMIPNSVITHPMSVTFYDLKTMMNLNEEVINIFFKKITPKIASGDGFDTTEAKLVSFVDGYCYLQFNQNLVKYLENIFSNDQYLGPCLKNSGDIDYKNTYLAYYEPNIKGRVKVMHFISNNQVKVYFIDYGCIKTIEVNTLIDLCKINEVLVQIPCQTVKVALYLFPPKNVTKRTEEELFNILGTNSNVSIFKFNDFKGPIPYVQLWNIAYPNTFINMVLYKRLEKLKQ